MRWALPWRSLSCTYRKVASPAAVDSGLPPKVEKLSAEMVSMISARATMPARVIPLPTPLANVSMSGTMSWA